jgi:serine/threonine protein kinase
VFSLKHLHFADLTGDYATFGRASLQDGEEGCKYTYVARYGVFQVSRKHFKIERETSRDNENFNPPVLTCHSFNGMMINDRILSPGAKQILLLRDKIKLDENVMLYSFKDLRKSESCYPRAIRGKFFIGKPLGEGNYGKVRLVHNVVTMEKFAIKTVAIPHDVLGNPKKSVVHLVEQEMAIMMSLDHLNLMRLLEKEERTSYKFMIMDYMDSDFSAYLKTFKSVMPENQAKFCFYQLCKGVDYLHERKIAHRDLKIKNIFVKFHDGIVQFCIGFSRFDPFNEFYTQLGSALFLAPEIYGMMFGSEDSGSYTTKADIWSLGCILFIALCNDFPFHPKYEGSLSENIKQGKYERRLVRNVSETARLLLHSLFDVNPNERPSASTILRYEWFNDDELRDDVKAFVEKLRLPSSYNTLNSGETFSSN